MPNVYLPHTLDELWELKEPCPVGEAVKSMRKQGYFLGGVLPRWFNTDGLLMQKLLFPPHWNDMQILTDRSRQLVAYAKKDWEQVHCC